MAEKFLSSATVVNPVHSCRGALVAEICLDLPPAPNDPAEFYHYLGYPAGTTPAAQMVERIAQVVEVARQSLRPRGIYAVYVVSGYTAHALKLGDTTIRGNISEYLADAQRVAVFAVTVGEEISQLAATAAESGDTFSAWAMDAVGSWAVEAAADTLMARIGRHLEDGQELTLRYSPGYCGMEIDEQRNLFQLVEAEAIAVTLTPSMLMLPMKSISGLIGLAPKESVSLYRSPCDRCPRTNCSTRR